MTSTDDLIRSLARAAGTRRSASLQAVLAVTAAASLACALLLVFSVIGIRDFADRAVWPGRNSLCQYAAVPDRHGNLRRRASSQPQAQ